MSSAGTKRESGASDSIRLPLSLLDRARAAGEVEHRSIPKQVEFWARVGQLVVESPSVRHSTIRAMLQSGKSFEELTEAQKFVVVASAESYFDSYQGSRDLSAELFAKGKPLARGVGGKVEMLSAATKQASATAASKVKRKAVATVTARKPPARRK